MKYFRTRLKDFLEWLKNCKPNKIYKNEDVNEFFLYMCIAGGILRTEKLNRRWRKLWLTLHILSHTVVLSLNIYGFLHSEEKNLSTVLPHFGPISLLSTILGTHALFCYFFENLESYTNELDEHFTILPHYENDSHNMDTLVDMLFFLSLCFVTWLKGFNFYFPMLTEYDILSGTMKLLASVALILAASPVLLIAFSAQRMRYIFVKGMFHTSEELLRQMRISSNATLEDLESSHNQELEIEKRTPHQHVRDEHLFIKQRNKISDNFNRNLIHFAKQYRKIAKIHLNLKTFFEIVASTAVLRAFFLLVILCIGIIQALHDSTQLNDWTLTELVFLIYTTYDLNKFCLVSSAIKDVMEKCSFEAYSCPWYLIPAKSRKSFLLVMTQMQHIEKLRVFGTFPLDMSLMPRVLDLAYSYVSVLQVLLRRSK